MLACLVEKANTTPEQYPLSTNALVAACNQKTSREPVVDYSSALVDQTMQLLRDGGWARSVRGSGDRAFKHKHVIDEQLGLDRAAQAVWAVLALRGPQSAGELKTRTSRHHPFDDLSEVEEVLRRLAAREVPLATNVGRRSGQSQDRWIQLLGPVGDDEAGGRPDHVDEIAPTAAPVPPASQPRPDPVGSVERDGLEDRLAAVEQRLARLERELGLESE